MGQSVQSPLLGDPAHRAVRHPGSSANLAIGAPGAAAGPESPPVAPPGCDAGSRADAKNGPEDLFVPVHDTGRATCRPCAQLTPARNQPERQRRRRRDLHAMGARSTGPRRLSQTKDVQKKELTPQAGRVVVALRRYKP